MKANKKVGIYKITCIVTGKVYVGSSTDLDTRKRKHFAGLKSNRHFNIYLQRSYNKYGFENFSWEILELVDDIEDLRNREQFWINSLDSISQDKGYNLVQDVTTPGTLGFKFNEEQRIRQLAILEKAYNLVKKTFEFIDPKGNYVKIFGLRQFCIENNLHYNTMRNVHAGLGISCQGWKKFYADGRSLQRKGASFVLQKDGQVIEGNNLKKFAKDNNLNYKSLLDGCFCEGYVLKEKNGKVMKNRDHKRYEKFRLFKRNALS